MKKLLALMLAALMLVSLIGCGKNDTETPDGEEGNVTANNNIYNGVLKYDVNQYGDLEITGFIPQSNEPADVVIPAEIEGRDVTGIGEEAFKACVTLRSVTFEGNLEYISAGAFYGCTALKSITLPATVKDIKENAFQNCTGLETVALSANLEEIGLAAFWGCEKLTGVTLPAKLETIDGGAFYGCSALTSIVIPESVKTIGDTAFYGCSALTTASYYDTATVGESVFGQCSADIAITVIPTDAE